METFNQLLRSAGVDPADVALLRHQTVRAGRNPHWLWQNDRLAFYRYQSTQRNRPIFQRPYWASFVSPSEHQTLFVGLFRVERQPWVAVDWRDPLSGGEVGEGKTAAYQYYRCAPASELAQEIGSLRIEWGDSLRQWTQYADRHDKALVYRRRQTRRDPVPAQQRPSLATILFLGLMGFRQVHATKKLTMLRDGDGTTVYVKNETGRFPVVIHPYYDGVRSDIAAISGVTLDPSRTFYVNSNLVAFPRFSSPHRRTGSRYGIALEVNDAAASAELIGLMRERRTLSSPLGAVKFNRTDGTAKETEREALCLARIGQGAFRLGCSEIWDWKCALTGLDIQELLRASHIKPWSVSDDRERLDPFNGLLLAAHVDALFDRYLISFDEYGRLICTNRVRPEDLQKLGIIPGARINALDGRHHGYLRHHRARLPPDSTL